MSRLISDVGVLQDFVTWSITGLFRSFFILTGIVVAMLLLNWKLALITFAVMPLFGLEINVLTLTALILVLGIAVMALVSAGRPLATGG